MYSIRADEAKNKKVLKLLSREAKVLDAIIEYLAEADRGDKISSIRKNVSKIFAKKGVKICYATIFHAVRGLTEVGLLRIAEMECEKKKRYTYELNREMLSSVKIRVWSSLIRQTLSPSISPPKAERKGRNRIPRRRIKKAKIPGIF